jgi:predicted ArsR family transcriptional regulator
VAGRPDGPTRAASYEPDRAQESIQLRNCPFHPHADTERNLVCGLNHALLSGVVDGLHADHAVTAALVPRPGKCCVELLARHR